jgi:hypothetical protein
MNANTMLNNARKAEREGNDEKAEELYKTIIDSFPDSSAAKDSKLDLNDLLKRKGKPALSSLPQQNADNIQQNTSNIQKDNKSNVDSVTIVDIKMPFWSMVTFMVEAALAAIPAIIIITIIFSLIFVILSGLFGDMTRYVG